MLRIVSLVAGATLLVALLWRLGPADILDALRRVGWYFLIALLLGAAHQAARAVALLACISRPGVLRYRDVLAIRLSGEAIHSLTFTGPVLAEPTKAWLLEKCGLSLKEGFAATLTEYLIFTFVTATMSITGLAYLLIRFDLASAVRGVAIAIISACLVYLVASTIAIARRFYLIGTIIAALARVGVLRGRLRPDMRWINSMEDLLLAVLRDRTRVAAIVMLEVAAQALLVYELAWLLRGLAVVASGLLVFAIEASVKVFEFVFLLVPLQLGVAEGAYSLIFALTGLPVAAGFALAFLRRARSLMIAGAGLATLAAMTRHIRKRRSPQSCPPAGETR